MDKKPVGGLGSVYGPQPEDERRKPVVTAEQRRQRMLAIEQLLVQGTPTSLIHEACRQQFGMPRTTVDRYIGNVRDLWAAEGEQDRATLKKLAQRRILGHIRNAVGKGQFNAVASLERLLADIQGTREATEVNVNLNATVTEAALHVIATMTPEQQAAMIEEQRQLLQLAERNKAPVIEAAGEEVPEATAAE